MNMTYGKTLFGATNATLFLIIKVTNGLHLHI